MHLAVVAIVVASVTVLLSLGGIRCRLAQRDPRSLPAALLLQALNDVFDLDAKRVAASRNHIPGADPRHADDAHPVADQPRGGFIRVSQASLVDLQRSFRQAPR